MTYQLVVIRPFLMYERGDIISDASKIGSILATDHTKFVTKIATSDRMKG